MGIGKTDCCCYDCLWSVRCALRDIIDAALSGCDDFTPLSMGKYMSDAQIEYMHQLLKRKYEEEWREYIQAHTDPQYRY